MIFHRPPWLLSGEWIWGGLEGKQEENEKDIAVGWAGDDGGLDNGGDGDMETSYCIWALCWGVAHITWG